VLLAAGLGVAGGACRQPVFLCGTHDDCSGLLEGACEPDGFCSESAERCESGRAYADHSGSLSGQCIDESSGSTGEAMTSTGARGDTTSGSSGQGSGDTLGAVDSGSEGPGGSSSDGGTSSGGDEPSSSGAETGGTVMGPCGSGTVVHQNDFEDGGLSDRVWLPFQQGMTELVVEDGIAKISVGPNGGNTTFWVDSKFPAPTVGSFAFEVIQAPPDGMTGFLWISIESSDIQLYLEYNPSTVAAVQGNAPNLTTEYEEPLDLDAQRHGRVAWDLEQPSVVVEVSPDGSSWGVLHEFAVEQYDLSTTWLSVGGGLVGNDSYEGTAAAFDNLLVCEP